jgi:hypothetical protein
MTVIGTGLLSGATLMRSVAELPPGARPDIDEAKVAALNNGVVRVLRAPACPELLATQLDAGRLHSHHPAEQVVVGQFGDVHRAGHAAEAGRVRGRHDLTSTRVLRRLGCQRARGALIVGVKSICPGFGTAERLGYCLTPLPTGVLAPGVELAWNPEFPRGPLAR